MSQDIALKMYQRDRHRAQALFKHSPTLSKSASLEGDHLLHRFEPDWSKFEHVYAHELLPQKDGCKKTSRFLQEVVDVLIDYVHKSNDRSTKVLDFHHPHTLREMMDHCLDIQEEPQNLEQILSDCKETLKYCVKTGHPRFFNQLSTGLDIIALVGEWLTATANTNMFTYEIAPVFTLMEDIVLTKMRECIGWENGEGDGIFAPGGAISNLYAVAVARHTVMPDGKTKGLSSLPRLVMFTSEHSHFSIKRAGALLGIGTDNVVLIKTDERGKMIPSVLDAEIERAKREGGVPFFVSATAGTTVLGAFDPFNDIADICEKHKIWFHVDGAWGGSALISQKYKGLLEGVQRADSMTWNPHKLMGILLQCSAILLRRKGLLEASNALKAPYLFQEDKQYDVVYDTGDKAIQCGRHNDVFKLWITWRANGDTGFENRINGLLDMSHYLQQKLKERKGFEFVLENPQFINVCFWYVPSSMRRLTPGPERDARLHKVAPKIKAMMMEKGSTMVGYQPLGEKPNFFRMIVSNAATTQPDIDFMLNEIERLGEEE
ncbi:hypothetical protein NP493_1413g00006 [Ridgeia piscesae]|uniref:Glutamate decarboxylase n=1 Tax=Ridgeia piscesae TaxID=27915 RepID=A0AAD9K5H0_RIDPI|nr:hypothetical protein NP493_1413g00006 [Ridgeia piscesae]